MAPAGSGMPCSRSITSTLQIDQYTRLAIELSNWWPSHWLTVESLFAREYTPDNHSASGGVPSKYYGGRILRREKEQVRCQTILKPAGEGELGCEPISSWTSSVLTIDTFANTHYSVSA